jgi:hypothetical protein
MVVFRRRMCCDVVVVLNRGICSSFNGKALSADISTLDPRRLLKEHDTINECIIASECLPFSSSHTGLIGIGLLSYFGLHAF